MEKVAQRIRLSVIIPTWNRAVILEKSLKLISKQINKNMDEIIIVDDGSNETNKNIYKRSKILKNNYIKFYWTEKKGPAYSRNMAIEKSKGQYLLFMNDDSWVCDEFVKRHLNFHYENLGVNFALVGLTQNHPDTINLKAMKWLVGQSGLHFNYVFEDNGEIKQIPWYYLWTCNFSVKSKFVKENNLKFCEEFPTAAWEDIEFAYRAKIKGLNLFFDSRAIAWHYHELTFEDLKQRFFSHGRGLWHLKNKLPENFLPFLIKTKYGTLILKIMQSFPASVTRSLFENLFDKLDIFPNLFMQWLVVKWKADGYNYENKKMSSL